MINLNANYKDLNTLEKRREFWEAHVEAFRKFGLSEAFRKFGLSFVAYCEQYGFPNQTFYHWTSNERQKRRVAKVKNTSNGNGHFVEVGNNGTCSIEIGNVVIKASISDIPQILNLLKGLE